MTTTPLAPDATDLFMVRQTGNVGQQIISPQGKTVAWTVDPLIASLVCKFLNEILIGPNPISAMVGKEGDE